MSLRMSCLQVLHRQHPFLVALAALASLTAAAQDKPGDFAVRLPIVTTTASPYYRATVPLQAYLSSARGDLRDMRVFNAAGQPAPYALLAASGSAEERTQRQTLRWFPLRAPTVAGANAAGDDSALKVVVTQAGNGTLVEVDSRRATSAARAGSAETAVRGYVLDASQVADRQSTRALEIDWDKAGGDFQLIDVESSDDLRHWAPLATGVQLARLDFNGSRIENRRVELPGFRDRYLRLIWRQPAQAPVLTGAELEQSQSRFHGAPLAWSAPIAADAAEAGLKPGEYHFHFDRPLPLARLRIELPAGNQLLPVEILAPGRDRRFWRRLADGVAYRITSKGREWSNTEILLSGSPLQALVLRVDPRTNPTQPPSIAYALQPAQVVFLASGEAPYSLAVGNAEARDAALAAETLIPGFGHAGSPEIADARIDVAGTPAAAPAATTPVAAQTGYGWKKIALWSVLVLGVAGMAAMAWQLLRQMKQTGGPQ